MDIFAFLTPLWKWWRLLAAATLLSGITSLIVTLRQPLVYQSHTTLIIGSAFNETNPTSGEFYLGQQLASMYADMANREPVRKATMEALGMTWLPEYVSKTLPNTQLLEIIVNDTVPLRAQIVAAELAHQLIQQSPTSVRSEDQVKKNFIDDQLITLQQQIKDTQAEIEKLRLQIGTLNSARQISDMQNQISGLESKVTTLQTTYANLSSATNNDASNTLSVIEPADLPSKPIGPKPLLIVALASAIGLFLASLGALAIEFLDDTLKNPEEISRLLDSPILGYIPVIKEDDNPWDYVLKNPRSLVADAFRMVRTNIKYLELNQPIKTILITSPEIAQGKSTISTNLAMCISQEKKATVLIDADLRKPRLQTALEFDAKIGLSDLFLNGSTVDQVVIKVEGSCLGVIPSGNLPPNPTELLGSKKMDDILREVKKQADAIIIDAPPLYIADALILSGKVDGVILVFQLGRIRKKNVLFVKEQTRHAGIRVLGIIINRASGSSGYMPYDHYYSSYGIESKNGVGKNGKTPKTAVPSKIDTKKVER